MPAVYHSLWDIWVQRYPTELPKAIYVRSFIGMRYFPDERRPTVSIYSVVQKVEKYVTILYGTFKLRIQYYKKYKRRINLFKSYLNNLKEYT